MKVCVASPYPLSELKGNSVTTRRFVSILREGGIEARASHLYDDCPADVLISLHAVKGAPAIFDYRAKVANGLVIVLITGTDLYESLPRGSEVGNRALREADRIVVVQEAAIARLPEAFQEKAVVVPNSLDPMGIRANPEVPPFAISVVGHPRPVKRPFLTIEAVAKNPAWNDVEVWQIGEALDENSRIVAGKWAQKDPRSRWFGGLPREEALQLMAMSSLTVNSSVLEGGANAILEAMTIGVPVLASRIEGNQGLLGEGYPGYFDEGKLEQVLEAIINRRVDLKGWAHLATQRLPLFSREKESACWLELLKDLNYQHESS